MSGSVMFWIALAIVPFWSIGAYNRLVRLRSHAIAAFAAIDNQFRQYVTLVQINFPATGTFAAGENQTPDVDGVPVAWAGLGGAATQFEGSLKVARLRPLDALAASALKTAYETLGVSWERLKNAPPDLAGPPLPDSLQLQWEHITLHADDARQEFNQRVAAYNTAIAQFPARLLAWLFGFKPAKPI